MKKLAQSDLQSGDILIFENQDFNLIKLLDELRQDFDEADLAKKTHAAFYLLLYLIPWFDPGSEGGNYRNIYHAAIWAGVDLSRGKGEPNLASKIVQAGRKGIVTADIPSTLKEDTVKNVYVYRSRFMDNVFQEKVNAATQQFLNDSSIPYAYETAWMLAVICSLRYSDGQLHKILVEKLGKEGADLMVIFIRQLINKYAKTHQKHMVACSTLVAMIYENAGYALHVDALKQIPNIEMPADFQLKTDFFSFYKRSKTNELPKIEVTETVITPRQLAESPDVTLVGYLAAVK
ncbi:hypothetical protein [Roseivirga pacifica]